MSALATSVLAIVRAAGGDVKVTDGRLRLMAPAPLPAEVIEQVRAAKPALVALLSSPAPIDRAPAGTIGDADDWRTFYAERAGIAEYDGGLLRPDADARAWECSVAHWCNLVPPIVGSADRCPVCNRPVGPVEAGAIPVVRPGGGHTWLHRGCHAQFLISRRVEAREVLMAIGLQPPPGWGP